jgi:hypothetical protein
MRSYTQDELCFIWQSLKEGTAHEALYDLEALTATIDETDVKQTLTFLPFKAEVKRYTDFESIPDPPRDNSTIASYFRCKHSYKDATWEEWRRNDDIQANV